MGANSRGDSAADCFPPPGGGALGMAVGRRGTAVPHRLGPPRQPSPKSATADFDWGEGLAADQLRLKQIAAE
jgi:hypothetical protein